MKDYNLAFIPSYRYSQKYSEKSRGQIALRYPWNGLVIADIPNMPNPSELKWGLGVFNGQPCDVGGEGGVAAASDRNEVQLGEPARLVVAVGPVGVTHSHTYKLSFVSWAQCNQQLGH